MATYIATGKMPRFPSSSAGQDRLFQYAIPTCLGLSAVLLAIAASLYPGGSLADGNSVGFIWNKNFFSNLFLEKALNGADNPGRPWALVAMAFHSLGEGLFFIHMAGVITLRFITPMLKVVGAINIVVNFLIATSLHDVAVTASSTLSLLGLFCIVVLLFRSKRHALKVFAVACMLVFYVTLFLYGAGDWGLLAVMQKVAVGCSLALVLALTFFTGPEDYAPGGGRPSHQLDRHQDNGR